MGDYSVKNKNCSLYESSPIPSKTQTEEIFFHFLNKDIDQWKKYKHKNNNNARIELQLKD